MLLRERDDMDVEAWRCIALSADRRADQCRPAKVLRSSW